MYIGDRRWKTLLGLHIVMAYMCMNKRGYSIYLMTVICFNHVFSSGNGTTLMAEKTERKELSRKSWVQLRTSWVHLRNVWNDRFTILRSQFLKIENNCKYNYHIYLPCRPFMMGKVLLYWNGKDEINIIYYQINQDLQRNIVVKLKFLCNT